MRLDERGSAIAKRDELPAITPGNADRSDLIARITSNDDDVRMPADWIEKQFDGVPADAA